MQAMTAQEDGGRRRRVAAPARQLGGVRKACRRAIAKTNDELAAFDAIGNGFGMTARLRRRALIQKGLGIGDDLVAPRRIIGPRRQRRINRVSSVEGVIETDPPGVGRIQRIARIGKGNDQLWARVSRDFGIDLGRGDFECFGLGNQIPDLF